MDALDEIAARNRKNGSSDLRSTGWFRDPPICSVIIGARNEEQLRQNLGAAGWKLTPEQVSKLDRASDVQMAYPCWHQATGGWREESAPLI